MHHKGYKHIITKLPAAFKQTNNKTKNTWEDKWQNKWEACCPALKSGGPPVTHSINICQTRDLSREHKCHAEGFLMARSQAAGDAGEGERLCPNACLEKACCSLSVAGMGADVLQQMVGHSVTAAHVSCVSQGGPQGHNQESQCPMLTLFRSLRTLCASKQTFLLG